ncbi:uncharacterized protein STEHIDRAFT_125726 [Stereum hirsutum FP-91666 SS1]|uniref:uncharacterized protein n=1 Tax=Stereum hirsutum (strain FP-91666) TaxID=721885 RepID=UPI000444A327|nr:uncharacterized protein STEHIDRAFT_125726 [Stereum hirsutum FP-91666 SS1]EIM80704.1 hypothetical protein STEHIDRAFT_125726 [Stereum hirsutum FP-91666 SS1]
MYSGNTKSFIALGVIVGITLLFLVPCAVYLIRHRHRGRRPAKDTESNTTTTESDLTSTHTVPVSVQTTTSDVVAPFNVPQYSTDRTPGANMRIACLRSDGSWQFTYPGDPTKLKGLCDVDIEAKLHAEEMAAKKRAEAASDGGEGGGDGMSDDETSTVVYSPSTTNTGTGNGNGKIPMPTIPDQDDDANKTPPPSYSFVERSVLAGR